MDTPIDIFPRRSHVSTFAINAGVTRHEGALRRPARRSRRRPAPLRLTRRGRALALLLLLGILLAVLTVFGSHSAATGDAGVPVQTRTIEVGEGDTLWGIASEVAKPGEVRDMVHQIEELNALSGSGLSVGQEIAVPVG
jgi:LysM domain